ncbi:MAG: hypothetical protein HRU20_11245 [Pseudomonadales bacterium]|nr:hypothetical protein [Pseudomonadales bacterium]
MKAILGIAFVFTLFIAALLFYPGDNNNDVVVSQHSTAGIPETINSKKSAKFTQRRLPDQLSYINPLKDQPIERIKNTLDKFWQDCQLQQRCQLWLKQLQPQLSAERFALLSTYRDKKQQLQQSMGQNFTQHGGPLNDKIASLKQKHRDIFGLHSSKLFAQEYALWDYKTEVSAIKEQNPNTDLAYKLQVLETLQERLKQENPSNEFGFLSNQAIYQQALTLIDIQQSTQQIQQEKAMLAKRYLSAEKAKATIARNQHIVEQLAKRQQYQQQFHLLQQDLNHQRTTLYAAMPESQWQEYQAQKIFEFRRDFFQNP